MPRNAFTLVELLVVIAIIGIIISLAITAPIVLVVVFAIACVTALVVKLKNALNKSKIVKIEDEILHDVAQDDYILTRKTTRKDGTSTIQRKSVKAPMNLSRKLTDEDDIFVLQEE